MGIISPPPVKIGLICQILVGGVGGGQMKPPIITLMETFPMIFLIISNHDSEKTYLTNFLKTLKYVYLVFLDYALSLNIPKYRVSDFSWLRTIFFVKNMSISLCEKGKIANMSWIAPQLCSFFFFLYQKYLWQIFEFIE